MRCNVFAWLDGMISTAERKRKRRWPSLAIVPTPGMGMAMSWTSGLDSFQSRCCLCRRMGITDAHSGRLRRVVLNVPDAKGMGRFFVKRLTDHRKARAMEEELVSFMFDSL